MSLRVLLLSEDPVAFDSLCRALCSTGLEAEALPCPLDLPNLICERAFDLMLLDLDNAYSDPFALIQQIRQKGLDLPIVLLSAKVAVTDLLYGLRIGADDCVLLPFDPLLLAGKLQALMRRYHDDLPGCDNTILRAGPFTYHTRTLRLFKNDEEIPLSSKENALMKLFIGNIDHIYSKDMLYELIWGEKAVDDNTIMVYISRLRQKIEEDPAQPQYLQTVRGLGYRFVLPN